MSLVELLLLIIALPMIIVLACMLWLGISIVIVNVVIGLWWIITLGGLLDPRLREQRRIAKAARPPRDKLSRHDAIDGTKYAIQQQRLTDVANTSAKKEKEHYGAFVFVLILVGLSVAFGLTRLLL
jgi:hypothetical protein